MNSVLIPSPRQ